MRIGLVLGGGGRVGLAYHAGALAALEHDLGWDPRDADVIVGTSAGSIVGALLRRGVPASDLAAMTVGAPTRATPAAISDAAGEPGEFPPFRLRSLLGRPRLPDLRFLARSLRRPWNIDPVVALASVIADGSHDLSVLAAREAEALGAAWPDDPLWLCATSQRDLRRVVFGRDVRAPLAAAVMASCSIPGYFSPIVVDGRQYVDGGVRSPTNADIVRYEGLDVVVAVSPMSGRRLGRFGAENAVRRHARRKVERELAAVRTHGAVTLLLQPSAEVTRVAGLEFMSEEHSSEIVGKAFLDVGEQLQVPAVQTGLADLGTRGSVHRTIRRSASRRLDADPLTVGDQREDDVLLLGDRLADGRE